MKKLAAVLCSIFLILFVSATAYVLLVPKHLTPLKLPAKQTALGRTFALKSVKRISKDVVQVSYETDEPQNISYVDRQMKATISGDLPEKECGDADGGLAEYIPLAKGGGYFRTTTNFKVPADVSSINISQEFELQRHSKRVDVNFKDVPVTSLPVTKSFNGTDVTLKSILVNKPVDDVEWRQTFSYNFVIPRKGLCHALLVAFTSRQDFIPTFGGQKLSDGRGNTWDIAAIYEKHFDRTGSSSPQMDDTPSLSESIVNCFNHEQARKMWERRYQDEYNRQADELANNVVTREYLYAFKPIHPTPKKISFSMNCYYPADNKDTARIVFGDVPIQK